MYFRVFLYSTLLIRSSFSETGLSAPVNKLNAKNVIQSIALIFNLLTMPPSLPLCGSMFYCGLSNALFLVFARLRLNPIFHLGHHVNLL
ncbi:hypothetical protein BWD13_07715 [Leptospira santarosai serovar Grippotyphosa]|nr:hypothetical protein BWD13_07715 [Leptospira santarosai serovar Grippotyphosa]